MYFTPYRDHITSPTIIIPGQMTDISHMGLQTLADRRRRGGHTMTITATTTEIVPRRLGDRGMTQMMEGLLSGVPEKLSTTSLAPMLLYRPFINTQTEDVTNLISCFLLSPPSLLPLLYRL